MRPSSGLIKPHDSQQVSVYLQPGVRSVAHEKFLVMIMQVEPNARLATLTERWKNPPSEPNQYFEHV